MNKDVVLLGHGGGGRLAKKLLDDFVIAELGNPILNVLEDGAELRIPESDIVFTTDSYVVDPLFFPGGDIGRLAVSGTVNDLVMQGAEPRYLSLGLILEEGFALRDLATVLRSVRTTCEEAGVLVVTGDTKVVEPGRGHGVFINTAGVGVRGPDRPSTSASNARPGDVVIVTGTLGDHAVAIMSVREGLALTSALKSDVAPLWGLLEPVLKTIPDIHVLRDPTRGGLSAALCDVAERSRVGIRMRETEVPLKPEVSGVCGILGLDPLNLANEGKALVVCTAAVGPAVVKRLREHPLGRDACVIGEVGPGPAGTVILETRQGGERSVHVPLDEETPRIC